MIKSGNDINEKNPHWGSSFDDFLKEEGIYEECTAVALKRVLAWQLKQEKNERSKTPCFRRV